MTVDAAVRQGGGHRLRLALMIFAIAGMNIGYTAILPFLPQIQRQLRLTPVLLVMFLLGYPVAKIAVQALLGGKVTDRYGPAVAGAVAWTAGAAGMTLIALASGRGGSLDGTVLAIGGRLVWGAGTGLGIPAIYKAAGLIADRYGVPIARLRAAIGAGAVLTLALGPVLAAAVGLFAGYRVALLGSAALSLLGAVTTMYAMKVPAADAPAGDGDGDASQSDGDATAPAWLLPLAAFGGFELVLNLLFGATEPLVPLYVSRYTHDPTGRAAFILSIGLGVWVVVTLLSGRGSDRIRQPGAGVPSLVLLGLSCIALSWLRILPLGLVAIAMFMVAQGHGYLVARSGIDTYTSASGVIWGRFNAIGDIGFLVGPLLAVTAYTTVGEFAFGVLGIGTLAVAAGYALLSTILRRRLGPDTAGARPEARSRADHEQAVPST